MIKKIKSLSSVEVTFLFFVIVIAISFRSMGIMEKCLWSDEVVVFNYSQSNFSSDLKKMIVEDIHPPLYYLVQRFFINFFPPNPFTIRLSSFIFSIISVILLFFIGKELFGIKGGIVSSLFLALSPVNIFYAQQARMYSMLLAISLFTIFFFIRYERDKKYSSIFLFFSITAGLYTYYPFIFFIITLFLYSLFFMKKDKIFKFITIIFIALLSISPLLLTIYFAKLGDVSAINKFLHTEFSNVNLSIIAKTILFYTLESDVSIVNTLLFLLFVPLFILLVKDENEKHGAWLAWFIAVIPPILFFIVSLLLVRAGYSPIYVKRAMIFISAGIALWFGFLISRFENNFVILLLLFSLSFAMIFENTIKNHKYIDNGYRKDVKFIKEHEKKNDLIYMAPWFLNDELKFYLREDKISLIKLNPQFLGISNYLDVFKNKKFSKKEMSNYLTAATSKFDRVFFFFKDLECNLGDGHMFYHDIYALSWFYKHFNLKYHHISSFPNYKGRHDVFLFTKKKFKSPMDRSLSVIINIDSLYFCKLLAINPELELNFDNSKFLRIKSKNFNYETDSIISTFKYLDNSTFEVILSDFYLNRKNPYPLAPRVNNLMKKIGKVADKYFHIDIFDIASGPMISSENDKKILTIHINTFYTDDPIIRVIIFIFTFLALLLGFLALIFKIFTREKRKKKFEALL